MGNFLLLVILAVIGWFVYKHFKNKDGNGLKKAKLNHTRIIDEWSFLLEGGQGHGDKIMREAEAKLKSLAIPNLKMEYKDISLGLISRMVKGGRKFLVVENTYLRGYYSLIGTQNYGNQLFITWYLTLEQTFLVRMMMTVATLPFMWIFLWPFILTGKVFQKIFLGGRGYVIPQTMDLFDKEELRAYSTTVHSAAKESVNKLMKDPTLNFAKNAVYTRGLHNLE